MMADASDSEDLRPATSDQHSGLTPRGGQARRAAGQLLQHPLGGLPDELVDDGLEVAGTLVGRQLPLRAGALVEDAVGVLDLPAAAELVDDIIDEPLDHLADQ